MALCMVNGVDGGYGDDDDCDNTDGDGDDGDGDDGCLRLIVMTRTIVMTNTKIIIFYSVRRHI